jgi:dTMP kinase
VRVGAIVAVEGLDGAGKATLVAALARAARRRGATVATRAFPRYDADVHAELAAEALHGGLGDVAGSVHAMALLFALDRRAAADDLRAAAADADVVLVDRYVASNAAYGAARRGEDADGDFVRWIAALEVGRFGVPTPDAHVLVRVPPETAAQRVVERAAADPGRTRDGYEADAALQGRCAAVYDGLAAASWLAPWFVVDPGEASDPRDPEDPVLTRTADQVLFSLPGGAFGSESSVRSDTIET